MPRAFTNISYFGFKGLPLKSSINKNRSLPPSISENDIDEKLFSNYLYTKGQPDPDFILRPSGEMRLSNFLLWQSAYAEFIYMDVLWPDFTRDDLDKAIIVFNKRNRRFGGV